MNTLIKSFIIFCLASCMCITSLWAQQNIDTIGILQNIVANKNLYIGKPFSELEKAMPMKIKAFFPTADITSDISKETSTIFYFIRPEYVDDFEQPSLEVYWSPYLNAEISDEIFRNAPDGDYWLPEAKACYKDAIIKDIHIFGWGKDLEPVAL